MKMLKPTTLELKQAYSFVCQDMLNRLAKAQPGESIRLGSLGAFRKRVYSMVIEGKNYQGYQFSFWAFGALKQLKYK
jgi:hypothetical protein